MANPALTIDCKLVLDPPSPPPGVASPLCVALARAGEGLLAAIER